jgi:hypothetical protein
LWKPERKPAALLGSYAGWLPRAIARWRAKATKVSYLYALPTVCTASRLGGLPLIYLHGSSQATSFNLNPPSGGLNSIWLESLPCNGEYCRRHPVFLALQWRTAHPPAVIGAASVPPKPFEPIRRQLRVAHGRGYRAVPEVVLASLYPQLCRSTWLEIRNGKSATTPARATIR